VTSKHDEHDDDGGPARAPWAENVFVTALANERAMRERDERNAEAEAAALTEHQRECPPQALCSRCSRFPCCACGGVVPVRGGCCSGCRLTEARSEFEARGGVPMDFHDVLWDRDPMELTTMDDRGRLRVSYPSEQLAAAMNLVATITTPPNFIFHGPSGSGKTSMAAALMGARFTGEFAKQPAHVRGMRFLTASAIASDFSQHTAGFGKSGEAPLVQDALSASLLNLDDFGQEGAANDGRLATLMKRIIRTRVDSRRPTWITTWLSHPAISAIYDGALADRLLGDDRFRRFEIVRLGAAT
jgi:hypothetical protein